MAAISIFIVFLLIKSPVVTGNIHYPSTEYTIINELDSNKTTRLILTNPIGKFLGFLLPKLSGVYHKNITEQPFFPYPTTAVQNVMSFRSEPAIVFDSSKRRRRSITLLPNQHPRRQSVPTGSDGNLLQAASSRKQIMADDHFWRSQSVAGLNQNSGQTWQQISGFPDHEIPIFEMPLRNPGRQRSRSFPSPRRRQSGMRSNTERSGLLNRLPESNGHILNPGVSRVRGRVRARNSFQTNKELENDKRIRNPVSEVMNPESRLSGNIFFRNREKVMSNLRFGIVRRRIAPDSEETDRTQGRRNERRPNTGNLRAQFSGLDWSGPVPWPRQERMQSVWQTQYALFPWWQKQAWTTTDMSDLQPNFMKTHEQAYNEDIWNVAKSKRGDVDVPDACTSLTKNGDCHFYRCFDRRHTCPLRQNFAYNVASRLCRQTEKYLNFFNYQAKKYIRDVKRCQMEALVPLYTSEVVSCAQIEAVGLDILTGGIVPPFINDVSCFFQNMTFCEVMKDPQNVQLMYDIYGGNGYTEYRVFIHFVKLIQRCPFIARESFNKRYARRFTTLDD